MIEKIKKECLQNTTEESCGLIVFIKKRTRIVPCFNWAEDKENTFKIDVGDYVKALRVGEIFGVYHSHVNSGEEFSKKDIIHCEELGLPYFVYSLKTKKHNLYLPKKTKRGSKSFINFLRRIKKDFSVRDSRE